MGITVAHGNAVVNGDPYVPKLLKSLVVGVPKKTFCTYGKIDVLTIMASVSQIQDHVEISFSQSVTHKPLISQCPPLRTLIAILSPTPSQS